jgi:hypothetical protein
MQKATFNSLTAAEQSLALETERPRLLEHDEDALLGVLERVRKQRAKAVSQYRRGVGRSTPRQRHASKAEVWEAALARVSSRLAALAKASAAELKAERLAAAAKPSSTGTPSAAKGKTAPASASSRSRARQPVERKQVAGSRAAGQRRQAARDAR